MKKIYSLVAVLAATFAVNAQTEVTKQFSELGFANEAEFPSGNINEYISFTTEQNGSVTTPKYFNTGTNIRLYPGSGNGNSITFNLVAGVTVTDFSVTADEFNGTSYAQPATYTIDNGTAINTTATNNVYTLSGLNATNKIVFKNANANPTGGTNQLRITKVKFTYTVNTASVKENNIDGLKIYPNPANDVVFVTSNEIGAKEVSIFNMLGKKVLEVTTEESVNTSTLNAGVYIMNITQDGKKASSKLVIK